MRHSLLLLLVLALPVPSWGQGIAPTREVEETDDGVIVTYHFNGGYYQDDPLHVGSKFWKIPGFAQSDVAGTPAIPFNWDTFAIPDDMGFLVETLDSAYTDTIFTLAPAYPPIEESDTLGYTLENVPPITPYNDLFPKSIVQNGGIHYYRDQGLARVATMPLQYNYQTQTVRSYSMIKFKVKFTNSGIGTRIRNGSTILQKRDISISDQFLNKVALNHSQNAAIMRFHQPGSRNGQSSVLDNRDYLIVTTPTYESAAIRLAEWKRTKGFRTHLIVENSYTVTGLKAMIMDLYNTDGVNLYYMLLIGGKDDIPAYENSKHYFHYNHLTDYYYGCIEDTIAPNDTVNALPSIRRGRLLVNNFNEANVIVDKIISYEQAPPRDSLFWNQGLHCAYFQDIIRRDGIEDTRFTLTSEEIKTHMEAEEKNISRVYYTEPRYYPARWSTLYSNGDSIPYELRKPQFAWDGTPEDIVNQINNKKFYTLYRGHGGVTEWENIGFGTNHISNLNNGFYLPVVFSITCLTGKYDEENCFAESFLKKQNGGCISIIAASQSSWSGFNDALAEGFFISIWPGLDLQYHFLDEPFGNQNIFDIPIYDMGSILDYGLFYMSNFNTPIYSSEKRSKCLYSKEVFHLFGDPSMMIYTEIPTWIATPSIYVENNNIHVTTTDGDARVSFYTPSASNPLVDSYVGSDVAYSTTADSVIICIDRHNCIPYIVTYRKNEYIQNETISDTRAYLGNTIKVGKNVTTTKPEGNVIIDGANLTIQGGTIELRPGTTIIDSNVQINPHTSP